MNGNFKAVKITENVFWVGAIDWGIRDFHGYRTSEGSSYNAYLIMDEKITLIDTVKSHLKEEAYSRISDIIDPSEIDYIISNHAEMDHSGSLPWFIEKIRPEKVFASVMGVKALTMHNLTGGFDITPVKTGDSLSLGKNTLKFIETRMLHWPDSMFSYLDGEKVLFSQDAFGLHLASNERFDYEVDDYLLFHEAKKYYANILTPYSMHVGKLLNSLPDLDLDIKFIANDHGPIWTEKKMDKIISCYKKWSEQDFTHKAVIVYDTMWESTKIMAKVIADGLMSEKITAKVMPLSGSHRSDIATELIDAGALIAGSSTLNNNLLPSMADVLSYIKGLRFRNLLVQSFGSYGWSGEACKQMNEIMENLKPEFIGNPVRHQYVPDNNCLKECFDLGVAVGKRLREISVKDEK